MTGAATEEAQQRRSYLHSANRALYSTLVKIQSFKGSLVKRMVPCRTISISCFHGSSIGETVLQNDGERAVYGSIRFCIWFKMVLYVVLLRQA